MTFSDKKKKRIRELIPLYVQGGLDANARKEVERAAAEDPELQRELAEWQSIGAGYRELASSLPGLSPGAFDRVRLKAEETHDRGWLFHFFTLPQLAWGIAAVQCAVIIVMSLQLVRDRSEFHTLGARIATSSEGPRANIVFREKATEGEIRRLLISTGARIVDGPSPSRCYVIAVADPQGMDKTLAAFRASGIVILAEKVF